MMKKDEVLKALENGAMIMVDSIYRTARVLDADYNEIDTCRYDTAERIERADGYTRRKTDWYATWFIEKERATTREEEAAAEYTSIRTPGDMKVRAKRNCRIGDRYVRQGESFIVTIYGDGCQEVPANAYGKLYDFRPEQHAVFFEILERPEEQPQEAQEAAQEAQEEAEFAAFMDAGSDAWDAEAGEEEQHAQAFPIITAAAQRAFEDHADGSPDETPTICGTYGRACRQMGQEEGANRALCQGCPLAAFCAAYPAQEEAAPEYLDERCPNSNEQPGIWYSIEYHYASGEGPYYFQARTVEDLEAKVAQLLQMGRSVVCGWRHDRTTGERRRFVAETRQERAARENRDTCRRIAEEVEAYAAGEYYRCPECGELIQFDDLDELEHETADDFPGWCYVLPCGCETTTEPEQLSIYDYLEDCLDIEYRCDARREYRSVRVMVTCGGPNIYIDTATKQIELYWWTDRAAYPLAYDAVDAVDDWAAEYWEVI